MEELKNRKYRFRYGYANPSEHPECPFYEGDYYVELSDCDVTEEGETANEAGFLVVAMDRFIDEMNTMMHNETERYVFRGVDVVPITVPVQEYDDKLKNLMEEYMNEADSMTDLILCYLDKDDSDTLTDGEIQALLEYAGDEDYVSVEDIREMANTDYMTKYPPYSSMVELLDWLTGIGGKFDDHLKEIETAIEYTTKHIKEAPTKKESARLTKRLENLKKYKRIVNVMEVILMGEQAEEKATQDKLFQELKETYENRIQH